MKNKKILVIRGSARAEGFTNKLCDQVEKICKDCSIVFFDTYKERFEPCTGCNYCEKSGKCVYRDLDSFFEDFETADLIIFASPVFNGSFSAPIKSLIDRFQVYYTSFYASGKVQQISKPREAILITASGKSGKTSSEYMKQQLECAFTILNIRMKNMIECPFTDTEPPYEEALEELRRSLSDD